MSRYVETSLSGDAHGCLSVSSGGHDGDSDFAAYNYLTAIKYLTLNYFTYGSIAAVEGNHALAVDGSRIIIAGRDSAQDCVFIGGIVANGLITAFVGLSACVWQGSSATRPIFG